MKLYQLKGRFHLHSLLNLHTEAPRKFNKPAVRVYYSFSLTPIWPSTMYTSNTHSASIWNMQDHPLV